MLRYGGLISLLMLALLAFFLAVETLPIPILTEPTLYMQTPGLLAALVGIGLLLVDVILPVPSSLVMLAHGALFGVLTGTLFSLLGSTGATLLSFAIGRSGNPVVARLVSQAERERAERLLLQWGPLAILVTRPLPILAETTAILAGTSSLGWRKVLLAGLAGSLPAALLYALAGATAATFANGVVIFVVLLFLAFLFWGTGRWLESRLTLQKP